MRVDGLLPCSCGLSLPPQDLTQANSHPSTKSSPFQNVKEAAVFHPPNHRWQAVVTINGPKAQLPCLLTTAAQIFDKLRSLKAVYQIPDFTSLPTKINPFLYILQEEPKYISVVVIQSKCCMLVLIESSEVGTPSVSKRFLLFRFISRHSSITRVWE